jgi:hypothetical protein
VWRELPGTAGLVLAANVVHLDPAPAVFEAMLHGWETQQRARYLADSTVQPRLRLMRRLSQFSNLYPWQWTPAEAEAFVAHLRSGPRPAPAAAASAPTGDSAATAAFLALSGNAPAACAGAACMPSGLAARSAHPAMTRSSPTLAIATAAGRPSH